MRPRDLFLSAALAAMAWTPSLSQSNPQSTPRFGITGGANLATLTSSFSRTRQIAPASRPASWPCFLYYRASQSNRS